MKNVRATAFLGAALAAGFLGVFVVTAAPGWFNNGEPTGSGSRVFPQTATASTNQVTLKALRATFSGTESTVELSVLVDGQPVAEGALSIPPGALAGSGFAGPAVQRVSAEDGSRIVVELPPIVAPGVTTLRLTTVQVRSSTGLRDIQGPWVLDLTGPSPSEFSDVMRVEEFAATAVDVAGQTMPVSARRSSSRTLVDYSLPAGMRELSPPRLVLGDGTTALPLSTEPRASGTRAIFPMTPFGARAEVVFGPFSQPGTGAETVAVAVSAALQRAGVTRYTPSEIAIGAADVLEGRAEIPLGFSIQKRHEDAGIGRAMDFGRRAPEGDIDVLSFRISGSWHFEDAPDNPGPYNGTPGVIDAKGTSLRRLGGSTGYSKNAAGGIGEGESRIDFYLEPGMDLSRVTLLLGSPSRVNYGDWKASLVPVR